VSLIFKSIISWDMTPCSPLGFSRRFEERIATYPPKRRLKPNGLHGVIFQKMILFITTAVKTSNPTSLIFIRIEARITGQISIKFGIGGRQERGQFSEYSD
jgi:hypothetical protein